VKGTTVARNRRVYSKSPLASLLGGLGATANKYFTLRQNEERANAAKDYLASSGDPILGSLGGLINPMTGQMDEIGKSVLSYAAAKDNAQANRDLRLAIAGMQAGTAANAQYNANLRDIFDKIDDKVIVDSKGKVKTQHGLIRSLYGIDPTLVSPQDKMRIADRFARSGNAPKMINPGSPGQQGAGFNIPFINQRIQWGQDIPAQQAEFQF